MLKLIFSQKKNNTSVLTNSENQGLTCTFYDRYPIVFQEISRIANSNKQHKILSFGCSRGLEVRTLNEKYFKKSKIDGIDIKKDIIIDLSKKNTNSNISYYYDINKLVLNSYDIIFCMSVLLHCTYSKKLNKFIHHPSYTLQKFNNTLLNIDKLLKVGGYLCIYNSRYIFSDSIIFNKYKIIKTNTKKSTDSGINLNAKNQKVINYPHVIFQKILL